MSQEKKTAPEQQDGNTPKTSKLSNELSEAIFFAFNEYKKTNTSHTSDDLLDNFKHFLKNEEFIGEVDSDTVLKELARLLGKNVNDLHYDDLEKISIDTNRARSHLEKLKKTFATATVKSAVVAATFSQLDESITDLFDDSHFRKECAYNGRAGAPDPTNVEAMRAYFSTHLSKKPYDFVAFVTSWLSKTLKRKYDKNPEHYEQKIAMVRGIGKTKWSNINAQFEKLGLKYNDADKAALAQGKIYSKNNSSPIHIDEGLNTINNDVGLLLVLGIEDAKVDSIETLERIKDSPTQLLRASSITKPHHLRITKQQFYLQHKDERKQQDITLELIEEKYQEYCNQFGSESFIGGLDSEKLARHQTMVVNQKNGTNQEELDAYRSDIVKQSVSTIQLMALEYGLPTDSLELVKKFFDPKHKDLHVPGGTIIFEKKHIELIDIADSETNAELRRPVFEINLEKSEIPPHLRAHLNLPVGENPLGLRKNYEQGYLTKTVEGNKMQRYGIKNNVLGRYDSKESLEPVYVAEGNHLNDEKLEPGVSICEMQDMKYGVSDNELATLSNWEITAKSIGFESTDTSNVIHVGIEQLVVPKPVFDRAGGSAMVSFFEAIEGVKTYKEFTKIDKHREFCMNELEESEWFQQLSDEEKKQAIQDVERSLRSYWGLQGVYEEPSAFGESDQEKYKRLGETTFVRLSKNPDKLPEGLSDFHSETNTIPGWIEADGTFVANSDAWDEKLSSFYKRKNENSNNKSFQQPVTIDISTGVVSLNTSLISLQTWHKIVDELQLNKEQSKGYMLSMRDFVRLRTKLEKGDFTDEERDFIEDAGEGFDYLFAEFDAWKRHESMHRLLMTQKNIAIQSQEQNQEDAIWGISYSGTLEHQEIIPLQLKVSGGGEFNPTHELLCKIAEGKEKRDLKDVEDHEWELAKKVSDGWVVVEANLDAGGQIQLGKKSGEIISFSTESLNKSLHEFLGGGLLTLKNGELSKMGFGGGTNGEFGWDHVEGKQRFDINYVKQYSLRQGMRSDKIEGAEAASTQGINPRRVVNQKSFPVQKDIQANPEAIFAVDTSEGVPSIHENEPNVIVFTLKDSGGQPYTGDSLTQGVKDSIKASALELADAAKKNDGKINIFKNKKGKYVVAKDLPEDLEDEVHNAIKDALFPVNQKKSIDEEKKLTDSDKSNPGNKDLGNKDHDKNKENTEAQFNEAFDKLLKGDETVSIDDNPVILARWQGSKLQGGGSIWYTGRIETKKNSDTFYLVFDSTTEIRKKTERFPFKKNLESIEKIKNGLKELYAFKPGVTYSNLKAMTDTYSEKSGSNKISDALAKFGSLKKDGNGYTKQYIADDGKATSTQKVTHRGSLRKRNGGDNVLFKVTPQGNSVRVVAENTGSEGHFGMDHVMDTNAFLMFIADKGLQPYCEEELDREAAKDPDRSDQQGGVARGKWSDSFVSISAMIAGLKKLPEKFKYRQEQEEKYQASLFIKQYAELIPDSMTFLYANEIKNDLITEHDDTIWSVINSYKDKISQKDGAGGTHAKVIARIIEKEVFNNPTNAIRARHKAAGYLLYAVEKGNMYIRNLKEYGDQGKWTEAILGKDKKEQMLRERAELFGRLKTSGASDDEYDQLVKFEMGFIISHTTDHPYFGPKFGRALDDLQANYSGANETDNVKNGELAKGRFDIIYAETFLGGGIGGMNPKVTMGALEAMEEKVEDDYQYQVFYKAVIQLLLSGMVSFEFDNNMKGKLKGICRRRGIPIGLFAGKINHPQKVAEILNYIMKQSDGPQLDPKILGMIRSLHPNDFMGGGKYNKIVKSVGERFSNVQVGSTIVDAFNYKNTFLLQGLEDNVPVIQEYFGGGIVFNSYKDYREATADGSSPFYDGIFNLGRGTFESQLLDVLRNGKFGSDSRTSNELWQKLKGGVTIFDNLIDGAQGSEAVEAYSGFIWKKFRLYFGDKISDAAMQTAWKAIQQGDEDFFKRVFNSSLLGVSYNEQGTKSVPGVSGDALDNSALKEADRTVAEPIVNTTMEEYINMLWKMFAKISDPKKKLQIFETKP